MNRIFEERDAEQQQQRRHRADRSCSRSPPTPALELLASSRMSIVPFARLFTHAKQHDLNREVQFVASTFDRMEPAREEQVEA